MFEHARTLSCSHPVLSLRRRILSLTQVKVDKHPRVYRACIPPRLFPLDEDTHTRVRASTRPTGAIFHGILLPSAHATLRSRQNARRRRDASFYLSAIYLPTCPLPKPSRRAHNPAGDRFEKLLIVPFLEGPRESNNATVPSLSFLYQPWDKQASRPVVPLPPRWNPRFDWLQRGTLEEVRIGRWRHERFNVNRMESDDRSSRHAQHPN